MKKLVTIALTIALIGTVANAAPMLVVEKIAEHPDGVREYKVSLETDDGLDGNWSTTSLIFSADPALDPASTILQQLAFGAVGVHVEADAMSYDLVPTANYDSTKDTWIYDGWPDDLPPNDTNMKGTPGPLTGDDVILSIGSGIVLVGNKDLIHIAAMGDIKWEGKFTRVPDGPVEPGIYETSGTTVPEPATMGLMLFGAIGLVARKRRS